MSPSKLGIFASLALATNAFLVPPTITAEDLGDDNALEGLVINPLMRSVAIDCPRCASASLEGDTLIWQADAGSSLLLNFEVGPHQDTLAIDGYQLYPPSISFFKSQPFHVTQVDPNSEEGLRLRVTGYEFHYNGARTISEEGTELLPMTFQITSVEGTAVHPPALDINVLKDTEGRLMIASFNAAKSGETTPTDEKKECKEWPLLCKWRSIVADRLEKMKKMGSGCHRRPHSSNPMEHESLEGKPPHRFRPGMHHPHHHHMSHHGHRHRHQFKMFLRRAFFTIFFPILIGIFAGILTYLVGMALGCVIAVTIAKVRGQRYQRVALEEDVEEAEERSEKEYADLPAYDAPPVYEEATAKQNDGESR